MYVCIPLPELLEEHSVGEAFAADPDALQHSVAAQLMEDEMGVDVARLLQLVGDDAADKVGRGVAQRGHQVAQRRLVDLCGGGGGGSNL